MAASAKEKMRGLGLNPNIFLSPKISPSKYNCVETTVKEIIKSAEMKARAATSIKTKARREFSRIISFIFSFKEATISFNSSLLAMFSAICLSHSDFNSLLPKRSIKSFFRTAAVDCFFSNSLTFPLTLSYSVPPSDCS